ncbi:response regulator [Mucilaginibacter terrae]|uniref:DNA-binding response OmpR family regulator n=1 Tax=Mucilaginibacter terrae TaxID=1955052 RepID=A0ABU3GQH2_9SPHI|nr:response regulator [Mucilaginibacter terrae]MDT3402028.1 DNA-binding response OmpR family regulator [Mucilaginibacter terrae]
MKTILIFDPDPDLLEIICLSLEMQGFVVVGIHNLNIDMMALIGHHKPGLILLDFAYAGKLCIKWCSHIKRLYPTLPVIALSCSNNIGETYNAHGFDDCICKPFDLAHLYATVDKYTNLLYQYD